MKRKYGLLILGCILMAAAGGCGAEEADQIGDGIAIDHGLVSMNGFVSDNELSDMEELIDTMITSMEENEKQVSYVVDEGVADNPLFVSFINNEMPAQGGISNIRGLDEYPEDNRTAYELDDREMYFTDYYEPEKGRCESIHFMTEDLDGDGEKELLINLRYSGYSGNIFVFHEQDESLYEWEQLWYGEKSSIIYLYDDYTIEWEGLQWARNFSCYTSTGRRPRVFDQYSLTGDLPDGGDYREYMVCEYQEGIRVKELKITESWSDDGTYLGVFESKAEEEEFHRIHDGFIDALGERKELNFPEGGFGDAPTATRKEIMNGFQFIESPVGNITPEIMPYVKEYVELEENEEIQDYEWMEYEGNRVLRLKIDYVEPPEGSYAHKKDYFLFMKADETVSQVLLVDYKDKGIHSGLNQGIGMDECENNHSLGWGCSFEAHFEDITFDGKEDLIISVGDSKHASYYCAYIYENNAFRYEKSFEHIPAYEINSNKKVIYGSDTDGTGQFYDTTYEYKNGEFVCVNSDNYTIINDEKIPIPEELLHDWDGYWEWYEGLQ